MSDSRTNTRPSTPAAAPTPPPQTSPPKPTQTNGEYSAHQLDVPKLHSLPSEQQDLYLLTFTTDLARHVEQLDSDGASAEQVYLKKEFFQIITLNIPAPTRLIRENIGRCFAGIFSKGNRKLLYESINELVAIVNAGSKERDLRAKHAATHCLGTVFEAAGDSAVSLSPLACGSLLKLVKPASNDTGLRSAIFRALGRIMKGIVAPIDEDVGRSIWKAARNAAGSDKSLLVQARACGCLETLMRTTGNFDNSNDFEKLQTVLWRAIESTSSTVRHAASSCLAAVLVKSYSASPNQGAGPKTKKPKKSKKVRPGDGDEEVEERASSPAPDRPVTALSFTLIETLKLLSVNYNRPTTSHRGRAGIANTYVILLRTFGEGIVEQNYDAIARHFMDDMLSHPSQQFSKYRQLITRKFCRIILEKVVGGLLHETAKLSAARFLLNDIIKDYPQAVKERPEPSKEALVGSISALTSLMRSLGAAVGTIAESCREGLLQVLQHPSFTVQIHAATALRALALACPQQLLPTVTICMNSVSREVGLLASGRQSPRKCIGYAYGMAAILSASSQHPLYGSVDVYARILSQATALLKSAGSSDLRISACQLHVAWTMIGGLMSLGPNFVKIHLSQLMLLWKNALPRPVSSQNISQRTLLELSYLSHVRECALGSIKAFLTFNQRLLTSDVSRRLSGMLENSVAFLSSLPNKKTSEEPGSRLTSALQLQDFEVMVRRRVFECFSQLLILGPQGSVEPTAQSSILPLAVASFSEAEGYSGPSSLSTAIASSAGAFDSIWDVADNYGYGVTGSVNSHEIRGTVTGKTHRHWSSRKDESAAIDETLLSPICGALENDPTACYVDVDVDSDSMPDPAATDSVNTAISSFALSLPLQPPKIQESTLEQMTSALSASALHKDPARKAAITVNISTALLSTLAVATGDAGNAKGDLRSMSAEKGIQSLLHQTLRDSDPTVRRMTATALGRLCSSSGTTSFTNDEVKHLTTTIVENREPHVRAGCALALAAIHSQLGGMAAGYHMKSIVGILMSLAADTHPMVHFWALESLASVAESAGLNFSGYVTGAVGLLSQLYVSDSHHPETTSLASSNMAVELDVRAAIARGVDAVINVLGPDLQDMAKPRDMIITLVRLFFAEGKQKDGAVGVVLAALRCMEHLSLYAPGHLEFERYVKTLQGSLESQHGEVKEAAVRGLRGLMRKDAEEIIRTAEPGLESRLWECLDDDPGLDDVKSIFSSWLTQTGLQQAEEWIGRCNAVLSKTRARTDKEGPKTPAANAAGPDIQDEEVAGFAASSGEHKDDEAAAGGPATSTQELMSWQVRLFAMELLHSLVEMITKQSLASTGSDGTTPATIALQPRLADMIRIAFSASTASVPSLRVLGLRIIDQILHLFGRTADPDFPEAMLLEQYQAQISSALTPAFAADSSPELAAEAVNVCGSFIATGIVRDIERMGRILKLLVTALEGFEREEGNAAIGEMRALGSNAAVMVRMAVLTAWARLQISSSESGMAFLADVVRPHIAQLTPLWLASLREYARLRFEPDISSATMGAAGDDFDTVYAALNRQTLLKFYQDSWLSLVDAIASLIDEDSEIVFEAMDGKEQGGNDEEDAGKDGKVEGANGSSVKPRHAQGGINYRAEPVAFFFVLFGLAFEALAQRPANDDEAFNSQRKLEILLALRKILRPSVSGNAIYQEVVFSETMDLLDRLVLTERLGVQSVIVEIARNLCLGHPSARREDGQTADTLSEDIEQLFELIRIIVLVLAGLVPGLSEGPVSSPQRLEDDEATDLVRTSLQALVDVSEVFPAIIKTDLHSCVLHIFVTIFGTASCQATVVPQALPIFRQFVSDIAKSPEASTAAGVEDTTPQQLRSALGRMLIVIKNAQKRESDASLPCEKNALLASTILLSSAPGVFGAVSDPESINLTTRFSTVLCDCLDARMTSRIAAGCLRSLLLTQLAPTAKRQLLTQAIAFVSQPGETDPEAFAQSKPLMAQTLVMFASKQPVESRAPTISLVMATLLARAEVGGKGCYEEVAGRLFELAGLDSAVFRGVVGGMETGRKGLLESVLKARAGGQQARQEDGRDGAEPSIALKLNF
ncbi:hypothetical protein MBLNU230_g7638t1 [Neophaeotheca triangularis]